MIKRYLMAPGPTPVPAGVLLAMAEPVIHHRTPQFEAIFAEAQEDLKKLFQTTQDVLVLAASGTGAMEAAVSNTLSPDDRVIVVNGGKFGERWAKICGSYGVAVDEIKVEWGKAVSVAEVEAALSRGPARALLIQASETSTGVLHPVKEIAALTRRSQTLLIVDGITAVGVVDLPMDDWGVDVLVTGSQKALMLPPGLAFISLSERAWEATKKARLPKFYFDLTRERDNQAKHTTAYTPAISMIVGLRAALKLILGEGLKQVFARHDRLARAGRAGAQAIGLKLLAPESPSPALTAILVPEKVDGKKLVSYLRDKMGVTFAGGQDHLKGKIVRIAHIGYAGTFDLIVGLGALEMALARFGYPVEFGKSVGAAQAVLMEGMPA